MFDILGISEKVITNLEVDNEINGLDIYPLLKIIPYKKSILSFICLSLIQAFFHE